MTRINQNFSFILPLTYAVKKGKQETWELAGNITVTGIAYDTTGGNFKILDIRQDGRSVKDLFDFFRETSFCSCDFIDEACEAHIVKLFDSEDELMQARKAVENGDLSGGNLFKAMSSITRDYGVDIINKHLNRPSL